MFRTELAARRTPGGPRPRKRPAHNPTAMPDTPLACAKPRPRSGRPASEGIT